MQPLSRWLSWPKERRHASSLCRGFTVGRPSLFACCFLFFFAIADADAGGALEKGVAKDVGMVLGAWGRFKWVASGWLGWVAGRIWRACSTAKHSGRFCCLLACWVLCYCCCCCCWLALLKIDKTNCRCRAVLLMSPEPENVLFVLCDFAVLFRSSVFIRFNLIFIDSVWLFGGRLPKWLKKRHTHRAKQIGFKCLPQTDLQMYAALQSSVKRMCQRVLSVWFASLPTDWYFSFFHTVSKFFKVSLGNFLICDP